LTRLLALLLVLLQHGLQALLQLSGIVQRLLDALSFLRLACSLTGLAECALCITKLVRNLRLEILRVLVGTPLKVSVVALGSGCNFQCITRSLEA